MMLQSAGRGLLLVVMWLDMGLVEIGRGEPLFLWRLDSVLSYLVLLAGKRHYIFGWHVNVEIFQAFAFLQCFLIALIHWVAILSTGLWCDFFARKTEILIRSNVLLIMAAIRSFDCMFILYSTNSIELCSRSSSFRTSSFWRAMTLLFCWMAVFTSCISFLSTWSTAFLTSWAY